jgi:DNA-binding response OmpR family regulator
VVGNASAVRNGFDLARALHEVLAKRPILLAAAPTTDVDVDALANAGVCEILRRPLVSAELAAALARCLRSPNNRSGTLRS